MSTDLRAIGYAPMLLPDGQEIWVQKAAMPRPPSLASQAVATRSATEISAALAQVGGPDPVLGPGIPFAPTQQGQTEPRRWGYQPGINIIQSPRAPLPISYASLKALAENYDVARICIEKRIDRMLRRKWVVQPKPVAGLKYDDRRARADQFAPGIASATDFFESPDGEHDWGAWASSWLQNLFQYDASTFYRRPKRGGGLYGIEIIDGSTIRVLIDEYGRLPEAPLPAYGQTLFGSAWTYFTRAEMVYAPFWQRVDSPYGRPPAEWILLTINRALRRQTLDLTLFTDGNIPAAFYKVSADIPTSALIELQEMIDGALAGNDIARSRVRFVPGGVGTGLEPLNPQPTTEAEEWLLHLTCAAYGVDPKDLGIISKGHAGLGGSALADQSMASSEQNDQALSAYMTRHLNRLLANDLGQPDLEFIFVDDSPSQNRADDAAADKVYMDGGVIAVDEVRDMRFDLPPIGASKPYIAVPGTPIFLAEDLDAMSEKATKPPVPPPSFDPGGADGGKVPIGSSKVPIGSSVGSSVGNPGGSSVGTASDTNPGDEPDTQKAAGIDADLGRWERKALRALREGGSPTVEFRSAVIPPATVATIRESIEKAATPAAVHEAFEIAKKAGASAGPFATSSPPWSPISSAARERLLSDASARPRYP